MPNEEEEKTVGSDEVRSPSPAERNVSSMRQELVGKFLEFVDSEEKKRGIIIRNREDILTKHYKRFAEWLQDDKLLEYAEAYFGGKLTYKDLKETRMAGGMIFDTQWRRQVHESLDTKKNQIYYGLVVKQYSDALGKNKNVLNSHLEAAGLPLDWENFSKEDEKGKVVRSEDTLDKLARALQDTLWELEKSGTLDAEEIKKIVENAGITNASFVEALVEKGGFGSSVAEQYISGDLDILVFDKKKFKDAKILKESVSFEVEFWQVQNLVQKGTLQYEMDQGFDNVREKCLAASELLSHTHLSSSKVFFNKYPIRDFYASEEAARSMRSESSQALPRWKYIRLQDGKESARAWKRMREKSLADLKKRKLTLKSSQEIEEVNKTIKKYEKELEGFGQGVQEETSESQLDNTRKVAEKYMRWAYDQSQKLGKEPNHLCRTFVRQLAGLHDNLKSFGQINEGEFSVDEKVTYAMQYGITSNFDAIINKAENQELRANIQKTYGVDLGETKYKDFWFDVYDPNKLRVTLPGNKPDKSKHLELVFKRKGIEPKFTHVADFMFGNDHDEQELFEPILELDLDKMKLHRDVEAMLLEAGGQGGQVNKQFTVPGVERRPIYLQNTATYQLTKTTAQDAKSEEYVYQRIFDPRDKGDESHCFHVFIPPKLSAQRKSDQISDYELLFDSSYKDQIKILEPNTDMQQYTFARMDGVQMSGDRINVMNFMYLAANSDTLENPQWKDDYAEGEVANALDEFANTNGPDDDDPNTTSEPHELDPESEGFWEHIGFSDDVPDASQVEYAWRNEGEIVARVAEGKVMVHASLLERQFNFRFQREEGKVVQPPKTRYRPAADDGKGWRGFRHMFGNYIWSEEPVKQSIKTKDGGIEHAETHWQLDEEAKGIWNPQYRNNGGQLFIDYLKGLVAHEKAHRVLHYSNIAHLVVERKYVTLDSHKKIELDQEVVCELVERWVGKREAHIRPHELRGSLSKALTSRDADHNLLGVLGKSGAFRIVGLDRNRGTVTLEDKQGGTRVVIEIQAIEKSLWTKLEGTIKPVLEEARKRRGNDLNREQYTNKVLSKSGNVLKFMKGFDTRLIPGYIAKAKDGQNPFEKFFAASAEMSELITPAHNNDPKKFYIHSDNDEEYGKPMNERVNHWQGLYDVGGRPNSLPLRTQYDGDRVYSDTEFEKNAKKIDEDLQKIKTLLDKGETVVFPRDGNKWAVGRKLTMHAPKLYKYVQDGLTKLYNEYNPDAPVPPTPWVDAPNAAVSSTSQQSGSPQSSSESGKQLEEEPLDRVSAWRRIGGDSSLSMHAEENEPKRAPAIMLRAADSKLQGFGSIWIQGILQKRGSGYDLILKDSTEGDLAALGGKNKVIHLATPNALIQLHNKTRKSMYKYQQLENSEEFLNYLIDQPDTGHRAFDGGRGKWKKEYMSYKNGKIMKSPYVDDEQKEEERTYIGKSMDRMGWGGHAEDSVFEFYRVQQHEHSVTVEAVTGDRKFKKKMGWTAFMLFMTEKQMDPYTETEYKAHKDPTHDQYRGTEGSFRDNFMSFNTIVAGFKKFPEAFKYRMEQQQKYDSAILYERMASGLLPNVNFAYLADVKADAVSELDSSTMQVIVGYKDRLSRNEGDIRGVAASNAVERIEQEIFNNYRTTRAYKHRAAGYLLYMLEKQGNPYTRALAKYAGTGERVKVLLGEKHRQAFLQRRKKKQDELKNQGREDEELFHDYIMSELLYLTELTDTPEVFKVYGSNFSKAIEGSMEYVGSQKRIDEVKGGIDSKGSIYTVVNEAKSKAKKLESAKSFHTLYSLAERCEEPHHMLAFWKVMMRQMVSGIACYTFSNTLKGKMKQMARTFGVPLLLLSKDIHHPRRVTRLIDNVAKNHGFPTLTDAIRKSVPGWDPAKINSANFAENSKHEKVIDAIAQWWPKYGYTVMDAFNNMDESMLKNKSAEEGDTEVAEQVDDAREYYMNKLFDGERNTDTIVNQDAFKAVLNPLFENGILNMQKPAFKKYLLSSGQGFNGQMDTDTRSMWGHLINKIDTMSADLGGYKTRFQRQEDDSRKSDEQKIYEERVGIVVRKFSEYFKEEFDEEFREKIQEGLAQGNIDTVFSVFDLRVFSSHIKDDAAKRGVHAFLDFFRAHPKATAQFADSFSI